MDEFDKARGRIAETLENGAAWIKHHRVKVLAGVAVVMVLIGGISALAG